MVIAWKTFIPHLTRDIFIIISCCSFTINRRSDFLINYSIKLDYWAWIQHEIDLLNRLCYIRLASLQLKTHFFFIICQVSYDTFVWSVCPLLPPKLLPTKNKMFTVSDLRNGKSSMLYVSNIWDIVTGKSQSCDNSVRVSLQREKIDGKWNKLWKIYNELG